MLGGACDNFYVHSIITFKSETRKIQKLKCFECKIKIFTTHLIKIISCNKQKYFNVTIEFISLKEMRNKTLLKHNGQTHRKTYSWWDLDSQKCLLQTLLYHCAFDKWTSCNMVEHGSLLIYYSQLQVIQLNRWLMKTYILSLHRETQLKLNLSLSASFCSRFWIASEFDSSLGFSY